MFTLKYANLETVQVNPLAHFYCKQCAGSLNSINGAEKKKQTCLAKYGCEYNFQSEDTKSKSIKTKELKYRS